MSTYKLNSIDLNKGTANMTLVPDGKTSLTRTFMIKQATGDLSTPEGCESFADSWCKAYIAGKDQEGSKTATPELQAIIGVTKTIPTKSSKGQEV